MPTETRGCRCCKALIGTGAQYADDPLKQYGIRIFEPGDVSGSIESRSGWVCWPCYQGINELVKLCRP